jgi:hypothetical protein
MPCSEPPETDDDAENGGKNARELAASIQQDFYSLIETIDRLLKLTAESDQGTSTALWAAHAVAKRGLQLSERLSKVANDNSRQG